MIWSMVCWRISLPHVGAVGGAHPGPQQAEVVVDLRHRAPRWTGGFLLVVFWSMEMAGAETLDIVHIGLIHLAQKHPGVAGQALHIPALALGVDGIKGQ